MRLGFFGGILANASIAAWASRNARSRRSSPTPRPWPTSGSSSTLTTRKLGRILRSNGLPRLTLRSGRASRTNSNTSRRIPARVIEAPCCHRLFELTHEAFGRGRLKMKPQSPVREAHSPEPSRDAIEMNSEDSFPASDAPSWTPFRRIGCPRSSTTEPDGASVH
jgi:hypothetical protein